MFFSLALTLVLVYAVVLTLAATGWLMRDQTNLQQGNTETCTLIVPFRNEEKNLPVLLHSLQAQNIPLHVLLVNDHSTDGSEKAIISFIEQHPSTLLQVKIIQNTGEGKKKASVAGLKNAVTATVFFTDADCIFPAGFFHHALIELSLGSKDFFYGPVVYVPKASLLQAVFFLDQLALNSVSLGLGKTGIHTYCSGANMGGKREKLLESSGKLEAAVNLSGDDVTYLQHAVVQQQKILAITSPALTINTQPPMGLKAFLKQRLRWGQKSPGYSNPALLGLSGLVFGLCLLTLIVLIACLSVKVPLYWWAIPLVKLCIDLLFLFLVAARLGYPRFLWAFLPAWLFNLIYVPGIALLGLVMNTSWKGRKVKG